MMIVALAIAGYAIIQFATDSTRILFFPKPLQYAHRASGTFTNPNHLAGYLNLLLPLALTYTLLGRFSHLTKILIGYASLVILVAIGASISRGGMIVTGITLVVLFVILMFRPGYRLASLMMVILLLAAGAGFVLKSRVSQKRFEQLSSAPGEDLRHYFWPAAIQIWKKDPVFGAGPGSFDFRYRQHRLPIWQTQIRPVYAHNDYLNALADWGIVGFALILLFGTSVILGVFRTWRFVNRSQNDFEAKRSNKAALVLGAALGLVTIFLHSIVDFNLQIPANAVTAFSVAAFVTAYRRFATDRFWFKPNVTVKLAITAALGTTVVYLTIEASKTWRESIALREAENAVTFDGKVAALRRAIAVQPGNFSTTYELGEAYRKQSWNGDSKYESLAHAAMEWFKAGMTLNPLDPYNYLRYGMCLDWIGKKNESEPYYKKALELDPASYYVVAHYGWHFLQIDDYATARKWFERSLEILNNFNNRNALAMSYLQIANERLAESTNSSGLPKGQSN